MCARVVASEGVKNVRQQRLLTRATLQVAAFFNRRKLNSKMSIDRKNKLQNTKRLIAIAGKKVATDYSSVILRSSSTREIAWVEKKINKKEIVTGVTNNVVGFFLVCKFTSGYCIFSVNFTSEFN